MKLYKKLQKAFGGSGLYFDKTMLRHLQAFNGDELVIELVDDKIIITKSKLNNTRISEVLDQYLRKKDDTKS